MGSTITRSSTDAWIASDADHANHGKSNRLWMRANTTSNGRRALVFFAKPFPHNDALNVIQATLKLYVKGTEWSSSTTVSADRITETWKENRVTWTNQPATTATNEASLTVSSAADGDLLEVDVTDIMQDVASGGDWFGFRLVVDTDSKRAVYASDAPNERFHPRLFVQWGLAPYPPTDLEPSGNAVVAIATPVLSWRFTDHSKDSTQSASQVQINDSNDFSGSILYDSEKQTNTHHRWGLAGATTITDGTTIFWRVKVWDDTDLASGWSDVARFTRHAKGTLTITDPGADVVTDLTPTIKWTFSHTQDRVKLRLLEIKDNGVEVERYQYAENKNNVDHLTIPRRNKHPIVKTGRNYRVQLYAWDNYDRVSLANDPAWSFAQRNFHYVRDGTPAAVPTLTATLFGPGVVLEWTRSVAPDWFCLVANGEEIIHRIEPDEVFVSGTTYRMTYWEATPREATTYEVEAVNTVSGKRLHSDGNATAAATTSPIGIWLIDDDEDDAVQVLGADDASLSIGETGTTYDLVGNRRPVRITDSIRGYEGSFTGTVHTDAARDTFLDLKGRDKELRLVAANLNMPVWLEEVSVSPTPNPGGQTYNVAFNVLQSDEFFDIDG